MDDEDEQAAALAAALDSLRHMSRDEMKTVLLDGSNDPEYIATVNTLFSRDDVSQEQLVEIFKETLFANNAEASATAPSASTSKQKKVYTSSEEEEIVVHRPTKKRILPSSDESVDSNETVNLAKVKKKTNKKEETKPVKVQKVIETISIGSSSDSETDRRKFTKFKEKASKEDVSKKPEAKKEGKSSKHEKESRKEHRMDKEPSRFNEESSRGREREKDKRYDYKSAARVDRKHSSTDRKDKTSKEEERKEEKRKAEKRRDEERQREKQREEKRRKEREEKREKERQEKQEKEREEKREKDRQEKREKERLEKREKEREEKREREREEKREKEREEKREREREEKREKEREEKREKEREEKREKEREEKREKEREEKREKEREDKRERERLEKRDKEREEKRLKELKEKWEKEREEKREKEREEKREKEREEKREKEREETREKEREHSKEEASKRCDETNTDEWGKSDKNSGDKEPHKSVSEINKDTRVKVVDQNLDTKLQTEVRNQAEADSVKVDEIIEVIKTEGDKRVDSGKNDISAVIDNVTVTETAARSVENMDSKLALASGAGSADANIEPAIICDTSVKDLSAPVPGSANKPSNVVASSSTLPQQAKSFLTKTGSFEAAISTEITKEHHLEPTEKLKNQEASLKEICFPPDFKVIVPQVPLIDPDFKKYKKKFRLKRLKVTLYDVQKQKRDMQEGDKIHRAEERKRKKERHNKVPEKKEKYSERGTRILPFEKRPENADIYGRKREIVREKPKTETPTEKQKRFAELHKKEREKEEKKKVHLIHTDFRIPKAGKKPTYNLVENIISSSTPLAPPVKVSKMHFDKRRMVTSTAKEDSWGLTPAEEAALKKLEKAEEKKKKSRKDSDLIVLDDEMPDFGFQDQDDDNDLFPSTTRRPAAADQEDDVDSVGYPPTDTPPAPIEECEMNDLSMGVVRLLYTHTCIELAEENATHADVIMQKCGRWFRSVEHEPYYQACPSVPEQTDEEFYTLMAAMEEDEDDVSFIGNVSNPDGDDDLQDSEITSTALDPDQLDEYCGAALLNAKLRVKPGDSPDCFKNILEVRRGCNYDKVNFQAKCLLCEEAITDKRSLGVHLRSSKHRTHLSETSLKLVEMSMKSKKSDSVSVPPDSKTRNKIDSSRSEKDKEKEAEKEKPSKIPENKPKETGKEIKEGAVRREDVKRHRSRSRSPRRHRSRSRGRRSRSRGRRSRSRSRGRRSRSRSPHRRRNRSRSRSYSPRGRHHHRRSMSPGRRRISHVDESLGRSDRRRSRSPKAGVSLAHKFKETDNLIFKEKLTLVANGKWTTQLEGRWKLKEEEEAQLRKIFVKKRKNLEEKPEEHELYNPEWSKFWERRYQELSEENKDPDDYDYTPEWKVHWKGFSEGILDQEFASRMEEIRTKFGLDLSTLRALNAASAPPPVVTPLLGHGPIPPSGHPVYNPLVPPPLGIHGVPTGMPPMPIVPPVPVPIVGAPPLPVGPIPPTYPVTMGYPAVAPPPLAPIVNTLVPPGQALASLSSTPLASTPAARTMSAEPPLVGRHTVGEDYEAKPMSISSGSDNAVNRNPDPPVPAVTVDDVKNTWLNYTGQKMTAAVVAEAKSVASNASSGKSQAFDYDGLDVVHVLRIMLGLEDELSFLAIQVQNYYQKAEKLEAEEKRKSFGMLSEADFVNLLKQCRDKFYSILKANVSPSDVMKKLNLAVFSLNALLESSACEKLRPAAPLPTLVDQPKVSPKSPLRPAASSLSRDSSSLPLSKSLRAMSNPIADALGHLPQKMLVEMSSIIAASLIAQGKDRLSDTELNSNLLNIFRPVLRHTVESPGQIDPKPTGQGSFSGLMSGTTESRLRKSGGSIPEDEGFGMTSFLPRGGGGGSWGRDGRNPIPEDQEKSDIRSTRENCSPFVKELGNLQAKSSELQTPSSQIYNPKDNEPYDPENEYGEPTLPCERRKSVGISPNKAVETVPTAVSKGGPHLPAGIANLIQKEKTARTLGAAGAHTSTNLDFRRPDRSGLRDDRRVNATSSISSISEIGEVKESKRYRRKSKKLKAETDYKHNSEHRKKRRRHSALSPERSTRRARDDRHLSRRHSDGMDRIPESRHAESHRKERHRGKEHRKRRSADGRELQKSEEHEGSHSRRHRRSKTKKKHKRKESTDSKVDGVSKHFWNESGSTISSEDNIPDNQGTKDKEEDETQSLGRHVAAYRASNVVEEGELICTSEEDFSDSPGSQEGNKSVPLQSEDIVSEADDWDEAEG